MTVPSVILCAPRVLRQQGTRSMVMVFPTFSGYVELTGESAGQVVMRRGRDMATVSAEAEPDEPSHR